MYHSTLPEPARAQQWETGAHHALSILIHINAFSKLALSLYPLKYALILTLPAKLLRSEDLKNKTKEKIYHHSKAIKCICFCCCFLFHSEVGEWGLKCNRILVSYLNGGFCL